MSLAKWIVANYDQTDYNQHECGDALIIAVTNGNLLGCQWLFTTFSNIFNDPESDLFPQSDILESFIFSAQENSKIHFDICKLIHQTFNINSLIEDDNDRNKLCQLKKNLTIREDFKDWFNEVFNE